MAYSSGAIYARDGRATPYWLWIAQRVSAVLLGPLLLAHIAIPRAPHVAWLGSSLLLVVLVHAVSGLWRLAAMRGIPHAAYQAICTVVIVVMLAMAALGVVIVRSML